MTRIDKLRHYWHYFKMDTPLFLILMGTSMFGLLMLYSASESMGLIFKQIVHFALAVSVMLVVAQIPLYLLRHYSPYLMLFGIFLLLLVLLFGSSSGGAQRWLDLGFMRFQPSELMKIIVPIAIASILSEKTLPPQPMSALGSIAAIAATVLLIAKQPDLGTSLLIGASGLYVLFFSGFRIQIIKHNKWLNLSVIFGVIIGSGYVAWNYLLIAYQKKRIMTMIDPSLDPLGAGYHILQSKIAIGSGGLLGKGIEQGSQSQLNFLPEHTTDFIFAVIAEELGFLGVLLLLFFYGLIIWRCFVISFESEDTFSKLLGASLTLIFFTYVFVNIGMVSGLLPVVGVPLPLISYGGSSLITLFVSFGIIMSIRKHKTPNYLSKF
ncbi:Rod shape-determining protein RodA [uncultured Gammaproteobacteria bacterium]|nr:Rod shape-determining protein RodA [uncultured Gammaproteobacteria bacterium]